MLGGGLRKPNRFKALLVLAIFLVWAQEGFSPAQEDSFSRTLYPVLEKATCRACHNPDGVASATRLQFPEADASLDQTEAFGNSLVALVDRSNPEESLLFKKPTNRIAHAGGQRIQPGSEEEAILKAWVLRLAKMSDDEIARALKNREDKAAGSVSPKANFTLR